MSTMDNLKNKSGQKEKAYNVWRGIKKRCLNKNDKDYHRYGGRGIKVCDRWKDSFENFVEDMGLKPDGLSIDRINNNGDYCPDNCRWANVKQQVRNMRSNHLVTYNSETKSLVEWSEILNISYKSLIGRINDCGWSIEKAFTKPIKGRSLLYSFNGKNKTLKEWSDIVGIKYNTLRERIRKGWSLEKALMTPTR